MVINGKKEIKISNIYPEEYQIYYLRQQTIDFDSRLVKICQGTISLRCQHTFIIYIALWYLLKNSDYNISKQKPTGQGRMYGLSIKILLSETQLTPFSIAVDWTKPTDLLSYSFIDSFYMKLSLSKHLNTGVSMKTLYNMKTRLSHNSRDKSCHYSYITPWLADQSLLYYDIEFQNNLYCLFLTLGDSQGLFSHEALFNSPPGLGSWHSYYWYSHKLF